MVVDGKHEDVLYDDGHEVGVGPGPRLRLDDDDGVMLEGEKMG